MKTIFTLVFVGLLVGGLFTYNSYMSKPKVASPESVRPSPSSQQQVKKSNQQAHAITMDERSVPKIDYVEQVKDMRSKMEHKPQITTIRHNNRDKSHYVDNEVVVRFTKRPSDEELKKMCKATDSFIKRDFRSSKSMIIKSRSLSTQELMKVFARHPESVYAEPNYLLLPNKTPNDVYYNRYQWNLSQLNMEQSWEISQGADDVVVAVVDTGVDLGHPEFQGKLVKGYNVLTDTNQPQDDNGHGSHVAGIIAARTNNRDGIAGISWNSKIMPIKAIGADGSGTALDIAIGIEWAVDHGAKVINLSVGNYAPSAALKQACTYANQKNVVLVAATGNDSTDQPSFPAAYPEVIGVGAVDNKNQLAEFSNYGAPVSVVAPGVDIPSTYIYKDYAALSGTSMACPHVAAIASLIRSVNPALSVTEIREIMEKTAKDLGEPGHDTLYGHGFVNVKQALEESNNRKHPAPSSHPTPRNSWQNFFDRFFGGFQPFSTTR
ncbi:S8 family peptidase [Brevibacillus daliensis]|uniref:S8 family peptidase n=1 Tax=Brevibacillus daliensis TaxID=2892995 RepID=UPI001E330B81|nr:S8 family peptidase [Brevibacillus daliensis]